jgi:hypothetical protein
MRRREPVPSRDPVRELSWLEGAVEDLGLGGEAFVEHVLRRLASGQKLYGDQWAEAGFEGLLSELEEEAADIGAWGVLALQVLETDPRVSELMRQHLGILVKVAMTLGAASYQALKLARDDLEEPWGTASPVKDAGQRGGVR